MLIIPGHTSKLVLWSPLLLSLWPSAFSHSPQTLALGPRLHLSPLSFLKGPSHCSPAGQGQKHLTFGFVGKGWGKQRRLEEKQLGALGKAREAHGTGSEPAGNLLGRQGPLSRSPFPKALTRTSPLRSQRLFHVQISRLFCPQAAPILCQVAHPCVLGVSVCPSCVCPRLGSCLSLGTASEATETEAENTDSEPGSRARTTAQLCIFPRPLLRVSAAHLREGHAACMRAPSAVQGCVGAQ